MQETYAVSSPVNETRAMENVPRSGEPDTWPAVCKASYGIMGPPFVRGQKPLALLSRT